MTVERYLPFPEEAPEGWPLEYVAAADYEELAARCEALEAALLKYGYHHESCDFVQSELPCTCGLEVLRSSVADGGGQS